MSENQITTIQVGATSTDVAKKPIFDYKAALAAIKKVSVSAKEKFFVPEPMNKGRPVFSIKVTNVVCAPFPRIEGIIQDPTGEYDRSQGIVNGKDIHVAEVLKEEGIVRVLVQEMASYAADCEHWRNKGMLPEDPHAGVAHFDFKAGDVVSFSCGEPTENVKPFSTVLVGISCTRYVTAPAKFKKEDGVAHGVSTKIQQFKIIAGPDVTDVMDQMWSSGSAMGIPWPSPNDFFAAEGYKHVSDCSADAKKKSSSSVVMLPLIPTPEQRLAIYTDGPGCEVALDPNAVFSNDYKTGDKIGQHYKWIKGLLNVRQWDNLGHMIDASNGNARFKEFSCSFVVWERSVAFSKINSVTGWDKFARMFLTCCKMAIPCNVGLYKTGENPINLDKAAYPNSHYFDLVGTRILVDLPEEIVSNIGIRVSKNWITLAAETGKMQCLIKDEWNEKRTDAVSEVSDDVVLLSEALPKSVAEFVKVAPPGFQYYAILSKELSAAQKKRISEINQWSEDAGETDVMGEPLLWKEWDNNPDEFLAEEMDGADVEFPGDHPLLGTASMASIVFEPDTVYYYAVNVDTMKSKKEAFRQKKQAAIMPPSKKRPAEGEGEGKELSKSQRLEEEEEGSSEETE